MNSDGRLDPAPALPGEGVAGFAPVQVPSASSQGLPEDILREASRRLGMLCLISAIV
jgi:hypothetical protein